MTRFMLPRPILPWVFAAVLAAAGLVLTFTVPSAPLLVYWLTYLLGLGGWVAWHPGYTDIRHRARHLLSLGGLAVFLGLLSTQIAARRAASGIHLRYNGVLIERDSLLRIGTANTTDVRLPTAKAQAFPWVIRATRRGREWVIEPEANVDQLRVSTGNEPSLSVLASLGGKRQRWELGAAARLSSSGDWVVVADNAGRPLDTLTLAGDSEGWRLVSRRAGAFLLAPIESRRAHRYDRLLRAGVSLSSLDGEGRTSASFERFVRIREDRSTNFGFDVPAWVWAGSRPSAPLLVTASAPFRLVGPLVQSGRLAFRDSAVVEVKQSGVVWRFHLVEWRRTASSGRGLALLFDRMPRRLDTPLPAGENCEPNAACSVLSNRPLPAPISYVSLAQAGFPTSRFGLLARLEGRESGFDVVLPRDSIHVDATAVRAAAVPVQALDSTGRSLMNGSTRHWVLLSAASGIADGMPKLLALAVGVALLIGAFYTAVSSVDFRVSSISLPQQRAVGLGITAMLGLLLTRTIIGARVTFFAPYLDRGIETVVGMWLAITVVVAALLAWEHWAPVTIDFAESARHGRSGTQLRHLTTTILGALRRSALTGVLGVCAAILLAWVTVRGVGFALLSALLVLLAWFTVAWVVTFMSAHAVRIHRAPEIVSAMAGSGAARGASLLWSSESVLVVVCLAVGAAAWHPVAGLLGATMMWLCIRTVSNRIGNRSTIPTLIAPTLYVLVTALTRYFSENGSLAALVLVVFVTLVSLRIGRVAGAIFVAESPLPVRRNGAEEPSMDKLRPASTPAVAIGFWGGAAPPMMLLLMLLPLGLIDMGLFLVMHVPIGVAAYLAAGRQVTRQARTMAWPAVTGCVLATIILTKVLFPSVDAIRLAETHEAKATAFEQMGRLVGVSIPLVGTSFARVSARGIATSDQGLAEELLLAAAPSEARDLLMPSIEQIWGAAAYSSAGATGVGLGRAVIGDRGVATAVSYAENSYSVYVLAEHGWLGGVMVLAAYLLLVFAVGMLVRESLGNDGATMRAIRALFLVAVLIVVVPAVYVALSNIGALPITGQNMPFLGLNAWSDVAVCAGVIGMPVAGTRDSLLWT